MTIFEQEQDFPTAKNSGEEAIAATMPLLDVSLLLVSSVGRWGWSLDILSAGIVCNLLVLGWQQQLHMNATTMHTLYNF